MILYVELTRELVDPQISEDTIQTVGVFLHRRDISKVTSFPFTAGAVLHEKIIMPPVQVECVYIVFSNCANV